MRIRNMAHQRTVPLRQTSGRARSTDRAFVAYYFRASADTFVSKNIRKKPRARFFDSMEVRSTYPRVELPRQCEEVTGDRIGIESHLESTNLRSIGDRSVMARRDEVDEMRKAPELNGNIKSLFSSVQMTARQAEVLLARIRSGYYLRPEVLYATAAVLCPILEQEP